MAVGGEQDLDRNEAATSHKLQEARKRGQVAKSADMTSCLVFLAAAVALAIKGHHGLMQLFQFDAQLLRALSSYSTSQMAGAELVDVALRTLRGGLLMMAPLLALVVGSAWLANVAQTGVLWAPNQVKPDWQRINPVTGFKRLFTFRTVFTGIRAILKLLVLAWVLLLCLDALAPQLIRLGFQSTYTTTQIFINVLTEITAKVAFAACLIALLDVGFSHREFGKNMRMSKREIKDEHKNREGDPRIRQRMREIRRELLKRSLAVRRTAKADVLITNPSHFAVALEYRHGQMQAPRVLCKGAGPLAGLMRLLAARHQVPIVRSPSLARQLYKQSSLDAPIPLECYGGVAKLMVWVVAMKAERQRLSEGHP